LKGFTIAQTRAEMQRMIDDARAKWNKPDPLDRIINLSEWGATRYQGEPQKPAWLVNGTIPRAVAILVAAMGDTGKSYLLLLLCYLVATFIENEWDDDDTTIFGGKVVTGGVAVMVTAEDSKNTVHRRLDAIDPSGKRFAKPERLIILPLPDAGGVLPFVRQNGKSLETTAEWKDFCQQLMAIKD